nr:MAG TPA: Transcriptional regulatory protein prrA regulator protein, Dna binding.77A [Caudoviricetes sp.]
MSLWIHGFFICISIHIACFVLLRSDCVLNSAFVRQGDTRGFLSACFLREVWYLVRMMIEHTHLLPLLTELASLTKCEQQVFLHCLQKCPRPVAFSDDCRKVAQALGLHLRSVQRALAAIRRKEHLRQCVQVVYIHKREELYHDYREYRDRQGCQGQSEDAEENHL